MPAATAGIFPWTFTASQERQSAGRVPCLRAQTARHLPCSRETLSVPAAARSRAVKTLHGVRTYPCGYGEYPIPLITADTRAAVAPRTGSRPCALCGNAPSSAACVARRKPSNSSHTRANLIRPARDQEYPFPASWPDLFAWLRMGVQKRLLRERDPARSM